MVLFWILVVLALAFGGLTYYAAGWWGNPYLALLILAFALVYWFVLFALFLVYCWIVSLTVDLKKPVKEPHAGPYWVIKNVIWIVLLFANVHVRILGAEKIPAKRRYLLVSNHLSNFDHLCYFAHRKERVISLGKKRDRKLLRGGQMDA
jgi:hypothetical protein